MMTIMSLSDLNFFFFNDPATPEIYTLSLHDALPICHREGDRERLERRGEARSVRTGAEALPRGVAADRDAVLTRVGGTCAEAADLDGHAAREGLRQLVDDDARATVDMGGILAREDERLHEAASPSPCSS